MKKHLGIWLALAALVLGACSSGAKSTPAEVVVSAAASLGDALKEVQAQYEQENRLVKLRLNLGSSGALQQQIEQGAPADLFISAATGPMDALVKKGLVDPAKVHTLASNQVVLIRGKATEGAVTTWADLNSAKVSKVAIGNPQHVPAGQYAKAVLEKLSLWTALEKRLVLGEDVRQILNYVESGEVQAGIVYRTDAASSTKVVVVAEAPPGSHAPVTYPMAMIKDAKHGAEGQAFADYLLSAKGKAVLKKYGFVVEG